MVGIQEMSQDPGQNQEDPAGAPQPNHQEITYRPWWVTPAGRFFKRALILGALIFTVYVMFQWFGWVWMLGLVSAPAWYFWALRQIDRSAYTLIEVELKGDEYTTGNYSGDTQTNVYSIPPDIWRSLTIRGKPYAVGDRMYICDRFDQENETVYFADDPALSNMSFYTRLTLWLDLKKRIPQVQEEIAILRYNFKIHAQEEAVGILERITLLGDLRNKHHRRARVIKTATKGEEVEQEGALDV